MTKDQCLEMVSKCATELGEHFDSVQIIVTVNEPTTESGTLIYQAGTGNWFARFGSVREWLINQDEVARCQARRKEEGGS